MRRWGAAQVILVAAITLVVLVTLAVFRAPAPGPNDYCSTLQPGC